MRRRISPEIQGIVTLYDILFQVGVAHFGLTVPRPPSFTDHIFPLLARTRRLQWVNAHPDWTSISDDWATLADSSPAARTRRAENAGLVQDAQNVLSNFKLTNVQLGYLDSYVIGQFVSDWRGLPQAGAGFSPAGVTRAALDTAVGQGFFPGIEAGIILQDPTLYSTPFDFRLSHASLDPGDLTALMALPWQADFLACRRSWWPAQRPDDVRTTVNSDATVQWERGINGPLGMVKNFAKLGFVTATMESGQAVFIESQRARLDVPAMNLDLDFEVLVVGGGPAGSACAASLAQSGLQVGIVETRGFNRRRIGETLDAEVLVPMQQIGIGLEAEPGIALPCSSVVSIWGASSDPIPRPTVTNPFGHPWRVDRCRFDRTLFDHAVRSGAIGLCPARVTSGAKVQGGWAFNVEQAGEVALAALRTLSRRLEGQLTPSSRRPGRVFGMTGRSRSHLNQSQ